MIKALGRASWFTPGARRVSDVNGKVIHRFISLGVFTFRVGNVILIIEVEW